MSYDDNRALAKALEVLDEMRSDRNWWRWESCKAKDERDAAQAKLKKFIAICQCGIEETLT